MHITLEIDHNSAIQGGPEEIDHESAIQGGPRSSASRASLLSTFEMSCKFAESSVTL